MKTNLKLRRLFSLLLIVCIFSCFASFVFADESGFSDSNPSHSWEGYLENHTDILLISSHADDEQLFFAGILPYYSQVKNYDVQVLYACDHAENTGRNQERLNGLWNVGIRNYPDSLGYADLYSESYEAALKNLEKYGISEDNIIEDLKEKIEFYKPLVIVTHDIKGEYGHGMHMLVNGALRKCLEKYGNDFTWLKKVYFHLYDENQITLDFMDESFDELEGKTPFQVTQELGFAEHKSQHWTWFYGWIYGKDGNAISKASQIKRYNPAKYGLFYTAVGEDVAKNDFFEGLTSYSEADVIARIEAEKLEAERLEKEKAEAEQLLRYQEEARNREIKKTKIIICSSVAVLVFAVMLLFLRKRSR